MRLIANACALAVTEAVLPRLDVMPFEGSRVWSFLILAAIFGAINAVIKPVLQVLALPFLFDTLGGAVIVINALVFALLNAFGGSLIHVRGFLTYVFAGLLVYGLALVLENVLGVTPPIVRDQATLDSGRPE
jgi:putative membrane protein